VTCKERKIKSTDDKLLLYLIKNVRMEHPNKKMRSHHTVTFTAMYRPLYASTAEFRNLGRYQKKPGVELATGADCPRQKIGCLLKVVARCLRFNA